ncbi:MULTISPECIES: hypothetical protein [unclassified Beijerinckia]|uniref:hypothetical protein n=1 Tax=unclassified Beijerinckia TaxID=2638183 RepID=UPI00089798CD|nr:MULTISPECIES: hypothetical protein [unclassified Beijerinckia]MDH7799339.1 hypothetical protein [Beijerinckia sp. GAS462]SED46827.1 hypothetical protein SAMN05443249_5457 [Beijerinckia sp. 28-YEA-48]
MKSSKPLSKSVMAFAFGAVMTFGFAAAPASAAPRHEAQIPAAMQAYQPDDIILPSSRPPLPDGCYVSRAQIPVVGAGLQWVQQLSCPYGNH